VRAPDPIEPVASTSPARHRLVGLARLLIALVVVVLIAGRLLAAARSGDLPTLTTGTGLWLGAALICTGAALVFSTIRWQCVLGVLDTTTDLGRLLHHYAAGQFVGNLLPTTVGGDVLRVARLGRETDQVPTVFASVVLERLTGWLVLPALILVGLALNPGLLELGGASTAAVLIAVVTLSVLVLLLWAAEHPRFGGRLLGTSKWRQLLGAVHLGVASMRRRPREVVPVLLAAAAYQSAIVAAAFFAAHAIGIELGPTAFIAFIPAVLVVQVLPLSISGLGLREGALVLFLHPLGVSDADAIVLGLLLYALNLVVSLAGAPSFALGTRTPEVEAVRT
jgi:uncharacterized protein (TIRG00374 family)